MGPSRPTDTLHLKGTHAEGAACQVSSMTARVHINVDWLWRAQGTLSTHLVVGCLSGGRPSITLRG